MNTRKRNNNDTDLINWIERILKMYPGMHMTGFHKTEECISVEFPIVSNTGYTIPVGVILIAGVRVFVIPMSSPTENVPATVLLDDGHGHSSVVQTQAKIKISSSKYIDIGISWCDFEEDEPANEYSSTIPNSLVVTLTTDEY